MINPIFVGSLIISVISKYLEYALYSYIAVILFIVGYGAFYVYPSDNKRGYIFIGVSSFMTLSLLAIEYFGVYTFKVYDIAFLNTSLYLLGIVISRRYNELIGSGVVFGLIALSALYVPNVTLSDVVEVPFQDYGSLSFTDRLSTLDDLFQGNWEGMWFNTSQSNVESDKRKIRSFVEKEKDDIIRLDVSPPEINIKGDVEGVMSLSVTNIHDEIVKNVYIGVDVGMKGRKYGFKVKSDDGTCTLSDANCYVSYDALPPGNFDVSSFILIPPKCSEDIEVKAYTKYVSSAIGEKSIFVREGEFGKTITTAGPLTIGIKTLPEKFEYKGGDLNFIIEVYTFLDSKYFENQRAYFRYLTLTLPSEISLERDETLCPYEVQGSEGNSINYVFEVRKGLRCYDKNTLGFISCKATVYEEDAESFINNYRTFRVQLPYVFYGYKKHNVNRDYDVRCEESVYKETFGLSDAKILNRKDYLIAVEGKYEGNLEVLLDDIYTFCKDELSGSLEEIKCAYVKVKGVSDVDINSSSENDSVPDLVDITYGYVSPDKRIINNYDGGDLIIEAIYKFNCESSEVVLILR